MTIIALIKLADILSNCFCIKTKRRIYNISFVLQNIENHCSKSIRKQKKKCIRIQEDGKHEM